MAPDCPRWHCRGEVATLLQHCEVSEAVLNPLLIWRNFLLNVMVAVTGWQPHGGLTCDAAPRIDDLGGLCGLTVYDLGTISHSTSRRYCMEHFWSLWQLTGCYLSTL